MAHRLPPSLSPPPALWPAGDLSASGVQILLAERRAQQLQHGAPRFLPALPCPAPSHLLSGPSSVSSPRPPGQSAGRALTPPRLCPCEFLLPETFSVAFPRPPGGEGGGRTSSEGPREPGVGREGVSEVRFSDQRPRWALPLDQLVQFRGAW